MLFQIEEIKEKTRKKKGKNILTGMAEREEQNKEIFLRYFIAFLSFTYAVLIVIDYSVDEFQIPSDLYLIIGIFVFLAAIILVIPVYRKYLNLFLKQKPQKIIFPKINQN